MPPRKSNGGSGGQAGPVKPGTAKPGTAEAEAAGKAPGRSHGDSAKRVRRVPPPLPGTHAAPQNETAKPLDLSAAESTAPKPPRLKTKAAASKVALGGYRADRGKIQTVRWLAAILGLVVAFSGAPALEHLNLQTAPGWARLVLFVAALQAVYVVWMLVTPDWSSVWVVMLVFAFVAAGYAAATAVAAATPLDEPLPLGMGEVRASAARWCGAVLLVNALATYLCGRTSTRWRRRLALRKAARGNRQLP